MHKERLAEAGIRIDASLQIPECPVAFAHLMGWYHELRAWGRQGFAGVHPLVWADADAWARRTRTNPSPAEWRLLQQIDVRFRAAAERHKPKKKGGPSA